MSSEKIDLTYIPITGPGVDAFESRKEVGSKKLVTEQEMRASYEKVKDKLHAGLKQLRLAAVQRIRIPRS